MFEKEAEEYTENPKSAWKQGMTCVRSVRQAFKDGAEYGYNKANEWHYVKDGDLPKDTTSLYLVRVYSWSFSLSHLYEKYGMYIPIVCEWKEDKVFGGYFCAFDIDVYPYARNIKNCIAWKEIVLPGLKESE